MVATSRELKLERRRRACAPDFHVATVSRDDELERSEGELERETGFDLPGTKHQVEFVYRLRD